MFLLGKIRGDIDVLKGVIRVKISKSIILLVGRGKPGLNFWLYSLSFWSPRTRIFGWPEYPQRRKFGHQLFSFSVAFVIIKSFKARYLSF